MMHVLTTLAHYTVQQKWTIMAMFLIMVSVTLIVLYLVRKQMFLIQKYFESSLILPFYHNRSLTFPETGSSTTRSTTTMTTTITEIMDPTSIITEQMPNEGNMQTVKQYLSNKGMAVFFRGLSILFILRGRGCCSC